MKLLYCVLFYSVIFLPVCYSQKSDSNVIRIDALTASGILLDKGWKFQAGDDPDYAKTGFDDKDWLNININQPVSQLQEKPLQKMSWYRLRSRDKSFNATFSTEFDNAIGKVNVVPQDIGRVILNLINNAFYAVNEREKLQAAGYKPQVVISTKRFNDKIEISLKDNGNGIPSSIKEKIFQPFFTTKPTGQGTGLGLSLAYDIVKAHGGDIHVETKEGEGSEFTVVLSA